MALVYVNVTFLFAMGGSYIFYFVLYYVTQAQSITLRVETYTLKY